ncbi:MAG: hypothetical protein ACR2GH_13585 [Pseudonocardia sp.]
MRRNLAAYREAQVFLNHPFDNDFVVYEEALTFGVVAAGLLPISARDLTTPDRARLDILVDAIGNCQYSAHDLSRCRGEGPDNLSRMNMPVEMGMALFHALSSQRSSHRCMFFVSEPHGYQRFASDLAGLDAFVYHEDPERVLSATYDWLRGVVPAGRMSSQPTVEVVEAYRTFVVDRELVVGAGSDGSPSHAEAQTSGSR